MTLRHVGYRAIRAARRCAALSWRAKLVMVFIADHADTTGAAYPSEPRLAREAGVTKRTVRKAVAELERAGVLKVTRRRAHLANIYRIDVEALESLAVLDESREEGRTPLTLSREERGSALPDARAERGAVQSGTWCTPERNDVPPIGSKNGTKNGRRRPAAALSSPRKGRGKTRPPTPDALAAEAVRRVAFRARYTDTNGTSRDGRDPTPWEWAALARLLERNGREIVCRIAEGALRVTTARMRRENRADWQIIEDEWEVLVDMDARGDLR